MQVSFRKILFGALASAALSVPAMAEIKIGVVDYARLLEQSPQGESPYEKEKTVVLRLAAAPEAVEMPKVVGQGVNAATTALEKLGLKVTVRWMSMSETATYVVLGQKPEAKTKLKPGDAVELSANR